nr:DUF6042 family protein [Streptomyces clavuligerus]
MGRREDLTDTPGGSRGNPRRCRRRQELFAAALRERSLPVPATVRELAATMEGLGLVCQMGRRWFTPNRLPGPRTCSPSRTNSSSGCARSAGSTLSSG